ncbi:glycine oxidase ThiO [Actinacidiphila yeochonensis]|uniref:glycine oxidase ThiO n=1 Tax=Actinacidiphila yeochonensis TaxID=89050 RepID=UPI001E2956D5|nr:glycine oxidase ThiO [Actinacidiphila yeochonensis]
MTADVLVVGGGLIGLVTAWRSAQRGWRTLVADPAPGGGAARVAAGMLAPVTELHYGERALLDLNLASAARYPDFVAELAQATGLDTGYRACGTLAVALDADDRSQLRDLHAFQESLGLESEWLTGRECRRLEPLLAPGVRGGLRVEGDHQVDPRRLAAALLRAAELAGVEFVRRRAVRLRCAGDRVTGADLDGGGRVSAGRTVLAAGSRSGLVEGLPPEARPPVRPVKGQILRLRMPPLSPPFLSRTVRAVVRGSDVYLVPRENGELVLGATTEETGWDTEVTAGGVYQLLRDAHDLLPGITELPLTETLAGLRPGSPDNGPLLGPTPLEGLLFATGHHRNGVLLTPVTGDAMARALAGDGLPPYALPFAADRFDGGGHDGTGPVHATAPGDATDPVQAVPASAGRPERRTEERRA